MPPQHVFESPHIGFLLRGKLRNEIAHRRLEQRRDEQVRLRREFGHDTNSDRIAVAASRYPLQPSEICFECSEGGLEEH